MLLASLLLSSLTFSLTPAIHPPAVNASPNYTIVTARVNGIVTGTVLRPDGSPLVGADLDFFFVSDGKEQKSVSGDYTNASGVFTTTLPQGTYDILVRPPAGELIHETTVFAVTIPAFKNVGTVNTVASAGIKGVLKTAAGVPLDASQVRVLDSVTGAEIIVPGMGTDPITGAFQFVLDPGTYDVLFDTTGNGTAAAPGQVFAQSAVVSSWLDLGTVSLPQGFLLSATLTRLTGGTPVVNCDVDVRNPLTNEKLYTPGDNSNGLGFVDVVVPAGTWYFDMTPDFGTLLVAKRVLVTVGANTSAGTVALETGVVVSGHVRDSAGNPVNACDLEVFRYPSNEFVLTVVDDTNAAGLYQIVVPQDILTLVYNPIFTPTLGVQTHVPMPVTGNVIVDPVLPVATHPLDSHYGFGHAGTGGLVPTVSTIGAPVLGNNYYAFRIDSALPFTTAAVFVAEGSAAFPFAEYDIVFWIDLFTMFSLEGGTDGSGTAIFPVAVPNNPLFAGVPFFAEGFVIDPGANHLLSHSDGLQLVVTQ